MTNISISPLSANSPASLVDVGLVAKRQAQHDSLIKVSSSSLIALNIVDDVYLYLNVSTDGSTVLSSTTSTKEHAVIASVDAPVSQEKRQTDGGLPVSVASELLARSLLEKIPQESSIAALSPYADSKYIRITFACNADASSDAHGLPWAELSARAPQHSLLLSHHRELTHQQLGEGC
ncbi:hypothetical protein RRF57_012062 [Xylaria bambusicola]|uniref:Uncharacterized protein n=1 Tax=Xylaria bambusicola TaxID=326684 RepID=A0AAN7Z482_9PEZI